MGESLKNYKIVIANDKSNYISADHRNNELRISQDIKLNRTGNGAYEDYVHSMKR